MYMDTNIYKHKYRLEEMMQPLLIGSMVIIILTKLMFISL